MFSVRYKGKRIAPSISAMRELMMEGKTLYFVLEILQCGYEHRRRKIGTVEKWLDKGKKTYNAVIVSDYNNMNNEEVWVLVHFGKFTRK